MSDLTVTQRSGAQGNLATLRGLSSILIWASLVAVVKLITEALTPISGIALIYSFSAIFLLMFNGVPKIGKMPKAYLLGCGALFIAYEVLFLTSVALSHSHEQVMLIAMINYLWPPITILLSILAKQLNFKWPVWLGFIVSVLGLMLVVNPDILNLSQFWRVVQQNPLAYGFAFMAALLWPCYNVLTKQYGQGQNAVALFFSVVTLALWGIHFLIDEAFIFPSFHLWLAIILVGAMIGISYSNWDISLQFGNIKLLILATYFIPILSSVMSMLILDFQPQWTFWLGVVLVSLGAMMCWKNTSERSSS